MTYRFVYLWYKPQQLTEQCKTMRDTWWKVGRLFCFHMFGLPIGYQKVGLLLHQNLRGKKYTNWFKKGHLGNNEIGPSDKNK